MVPFHICLDLYNEGFKVHGNFKLTWMRLKLIQREIPPKEGEKKAEEKPEEKPEEKTKFDIKRIPKIISLLMDSWQYIQRILNAFLKSTSIERINFDLIIGLGDPVNTAMVSGCLWSVVPLVNVIPNTYFSIEPDFINVGLKGRLEADIKIRLLWIVIEFIRALTKKPVRMLIGELRGLRS